MDGAHLQSGQRESQQHAQEVSLVCPLYYIMLPRQQTLIGGNGTVSQDCQQ